MSRILVHAPTVDVQCERCQARFRLTSSPGSAKAQTMPCPRCEHPIDVEDQRPWSALGHERLFQPDKIEQTTSIAPFDTQPERTVQHEPVDTPFWLDMDLSFDRPIVPIPTHQMLMKTRDAYVYESMIADFLFYEQLSNARPELFVFIVPAQTGPIKSVKVPPIPHKIVPVLADAEVMDVFDEAQPGPGVVDAPNVQEHLVPEEMFDPTSSSRKVMMVCGFMLMMLGVFFAGVWVHSKFATRPAPKAPGVVQSIPTSAVIQMASTTVHLAALRDTSSASTRRAVAQGLMNDGRADRAVGLLAWMWRQPRYRDLLTARLYAQALVRAKRWHKARKIAMFGLVLDAKDKHLQAAFQEAIAHDPTLKKRLVTLGQEAQFIDEIRALGGGKSISLKMKKKGKNVFAFKPRQRLWEEGWRAEIASDTLCDVMQCGFHVPRNRPARISKANFERLYGVHRSKKQTAYQLRFDALLYAKEDGTPYLYGTLKDWLPGFINWPLEYDEIWKPWLKQETSLEVLKHARLHKTLSSLRKVQRGRFYNAMLVEREGLTVLGFADQISQMMVFDVLVSNWDRFSPLEAYYGANTHFSRGRLISLDNGAAFHTQHMQRLDEVLVHLERFNRHQIAAIRAMTPESLNHVLFPTQDADSKQRLLVFWLQRKRLLRHVDAMIERYGEDAVLVF